MIGERYFALLDDEDGACLLLSQYRRTVQVDACAGTGTDSGEMAFAAIAKAAAGNEWCTICVDYGFAASLDSALNSLDLGRALFRVHVFGRAEKLDAEAVAVFLKSRVAALEDDARFAGIAEIEPALSEADYISRVARIHELITEGDCYQINLTFPIGFRYFGDPLALYQRLRERQPVRYGGFVHTPDQTVLSFSPELFFQRTGDRVVTRPMKGTAARGETPEADERQRRELLASPKERAENVMIVDLLRNDLSRLARPGEVRVDELCAVEAYPTLWQQVSTVSASLPGVSLQALFQALFPCGSITGAPKIQAMRRIAELEVGNRGLYTGTLGWVAPGGNCRLNVAIRTIELENDGRGRLHVGSGVVIDAQADREYAECLLKARFLTAADPGFRLIETMRVEDGLCHLIALHLRRLAHSAATFGFGCDLERVMAALDEGITQYPRGVIRVRLTLAHNGEVEVTTGSLAPIDGLLRIRVAEQRLDSTAYLLRHKTTVRSDYDRALASLAELPDVFDFLYLNERGEVCEGARSNIFIERDGCLLTPATSCGLLPGVLRAHLLETGKAVEAVLSLGDLERAPAIYAGNALRGLIPVSLSR